MESLSVQRLVQALSELNPKLALSISRRVEYSGRLGLNSRYPDNLNHCSRRMRQTQHYNIKAVC